MDYKESIYHGFVRWDFTFEDRQATLVFPKEAEAEKRWLLKTEYFEAFPAFELEMLARGYHLAYVSNITRWYAEDDAHSKARFAAFYQFVYDTANTAAVADDTKLQHIFSRFRLNFGISSLKV